MATKKKTTGGAKKGLILAGVAAAAAAGAYYLYGPKGKQHRKKIKGWTLKAQGEVMERVEKLKEVDRESLNKIVDTVAKKYKTAQGISTAEVVAFAKDVKGQWSHIEKEFKKGVAATKKVVKKSKKTAKK
ncbi:hypothetical protein HQ403_02640 [Candidatus Kaiserbacteria bacterium]|nr:hypothetical protein [Candidatus Kaiserbacteria bacterium]